MDLQSWTNQDGDRGRLGRLSVGFALGVVGMMGLMTFLSVAGGSVTQVITQEDEVVDVQLAKVPETEPEVEEEPEPEPDLAPRAAGPVMPKLVIPTEIPKDAPRETDAPRDGATGDGDPYANAGGGGAGKGRGAPTPTPPKEKPAQKPKPPPTPEKKKVFRANEVSVQPVAQSRAYPAYPASARSAGIEGVVVVRYVITETGSTAAVKAVRGPSELMSVCETAVRSWTFTPARNEAGQAVPLVKFARFPFKIKI